MTATRSARSPRRPARATAVAPVPAAAPAGRPKDPEKRLAILEAGKRLFPTLGFKGTSMDAIAAEAGVSKLTVYSHFADKDSLFTEVCRCKCEQQMPPQIFRIDRNAPLREQLRAIGRAFYELVMSPESIALHRLMTAQPEPKLAQLFWEAGPQRAKEQLSAFLSAEVAEGALEIDDVHRAAGHFFCLLKGEPFMRVTYGAGKVSKAEAAAHVEAVVELFVRAYGRARAQGPGPRAQGPGHRA